MTRTGWVEEGMESPLRGSVGRFEVISRIEKWRGSKLVQAGPCLDGCHMDRGARERAEKVLRRHG